MAYATPDRDIAVFARLHGGNLGRRDHSRRGRPDGQEHGCSSPEAYSGALTSPSFDAVEAASVTFQAWFEVEAVEPTGRDEAILQYDLGGSGDWVEFGRLNPVGVGGGTADQGWSNNGLATAPSFQSYTFF